MEFNCLVCGKKIEIKDEICTLGRGNGKTVLTLYTYVKRYCCSEECMDKYITVIKNAIYEVNK